jgi:CrcB protein
MKHFLLVFVGAGVGGALRHGVNAAALRFFGSAFPYGTLAVNIAGSLVMGVLTGWFALKADPGLEWRLFLATGVLGGFTTFSAFSLDTVLLWERGQFWHAGLYVLVSVSLSILAFAGGLASIRAMN